jgi:SAM-dependent methyltransferase
VSGDRGTPSAGDWDDFWHNARAAAAHQAGSLQDAPLEAFWQRLFAEAVPRLPEQARVLDLGCGSGAVLGHAIAAGGRDWFLAGLDPAVAGLKVLRSRHPRAFGVAADAARLPFAGESFHIVASQFGLEYAGAPAVPEAARLVAPGGLLAAVMHLRYGGLYEECAVNRDAADGFLRSGLLIRFADLYEAGAALQAGRADRAAYSQADRRLSRAVKAAEAVLQRWGRGVADGRLFRIYSDVGQMYQRLGAHDPGEIREWARRMTDELRHFIGRMSAMLEVALDAAAMDGIVAALQTGGLALRLRDNLVGPNAVPWAWVVLAERPASPG